MDLKKLWPALTGLVTLIVSTFSDPLLVWIQAHPIESLSLSQILTVVANLVKSPIPPEGPTS